MLSPRQAPSALMMRLTTRLRLSASLIPAERNCTSIFQEMQLAFVGYLIKEHHRADASQWNQPASNHISNIEPLPRNRSLLRTRLVPRFPQIIPSAAVRGKLIAFQLLPIGASGLRIGQGLCFVLCRRAGERSSP